MRPLASLTNARRGFVCAAILIALAGLGAGTVQGAASSKKFTASITASGATYTLTISNSPSSSQDLGSANVTVPTGYAVTGFVSTTAAGGTKTWSTPTLSSDGRTMYLRNSGPNAVNRLSPGQSLVVVFTASASCAIATSVWTVAAKQSNDFNGFGNDFTISGSQPTTTTQPGALDHFTVSSVPQQTAGTAFSVTVKAFDVCGNQKTNYGGGAILGGLGNAPSGQGPLYGTLSFSAGAATATVKPFLAGPNQTLTVTDGSVVTASNPFTVLPGPLSSFALGSVADPQSAGTSFSLTATARDAWLNVKTNYAGGATLSGNLGTSTKGCGSGASSPCSPLYGAFAFASGLGSASVTGYKAEAVRQLTVSDGSVSASSNTFTVNPGPLASLDFATIPTQSAGIAFTITVTASDAYGNVKTNYAGSPTLGGNLGVTASGCGSGGSSPCAPSYGALSFASGVASTTVTAYKAETARTLNASDGSVAGGSNQFDVAGGTVATLGVGQQPTDTKFGTVITPAVTILAADAYGNPAGATVTMAIGSNPGSGTLSGTKVRGTVGGTAMFNDLSIDKTGIHYTLVATVGSITTTSAQFDIVTVEVGCANHPLEPCVGSTGNDTNQQTTTNAQVFAPAGGNPGNLTITLVDFTGACGNGAGDSIVVNPPTGHGNDNPIQIGAEYDKSVAPGTGVANFVFCLEKASGLVIQTVPACKDSAGTLQPYPCIDDRRRDNAGDLHVAFLVTDDPVITKR